MAGMRLPIESHILQAFVTEGLKPVIHHVVSFGMGHFYISQSDKGGSSSGAIWISTPATPRGATCRWWSM